MGPLGLVWGAHPPREQNEGGRWHRTTEAASQRQRAEESAPLWGRKRERTKVNPTQGLFCKFAQMNTVFECKFVQNVSIRVHAAREDMTRYDG